VELDPRRTAIVAVHLQKDVVNADGAFGGFFAAQAVERDVVTVNQRLLDAARDAGATVVYTRVAWQPGLADLVVNSPILGIVAQTGCLLEGSDKAQILPELAPQDTDLVVTHQRVGGFTGSLLDTLLRGRGIDTLLFTGVATNFSVEGTARQASDLGYRTLVVDDACSAADPATHAASIASIGLLAEIVTSSEVLIALTATAVPATARS
jgi:nicotinamidase-related amidase